MKSIKLPSWIESLLGLGPVAPPPHAFRLDATGIEYAGFERRAEGLVLVRAERIELPAETFQPGLLGGPAREPAALRAAVSELVGRLEGVREATLVLPDAWLRVAFTDTAPLPSNSADRDEVLRWKLKRLVPFRVEELRLAAEEVEPLPDPSPEEPKRVLLGFGVEALLGQLEEAFAASSVRLGRITSESLALLSAVLAARGGNGDDRLLALVQVGDGGYTLIFARHGRPVLHRYKGFAAALPDGSRGGFVVRDLRLTRTFLDESFPGATVEGALVAAPLGDEGPWIEWLQEALDAPAGGLERGHLPPLELAARGVEWDRLAPLVGAVSQEVA